ncbi:MAG: lysoplasmalogenase [Bacilli bacterium]|nr:lysoplasmalogenase [Bacilli bacterium]
MRIDQLPIATYVFLSLFLISSIVHLVFCFLEKERIRKISKPFPLLFLMVALIFARIDHPLIYIGSFFCLAGDVALLRKHKVWWFSFGLIFFLIGHILFIAEMGIQMGNVPWYSYLINGLILIVYVILLFNKWRKLIRHKNIRLGAIIYSFVLISALCWAIIGSIFFSRPNFILVAVGYLLFIVSDLTLAITLFKRDVKRRDFYIMVTYLSASLLIGLGLILAF